MLPAGSNLGTYRIESLLGRGAMGAVYRAIDQEHDRVAALKVIHADLLAGQECDLMQARFRQEAQIGIQLRHPLIVQVYEYGEENNLFYLAMELVEGQELGQLLTEQPKLPLGMHLALVLQILNALAYVHQHGIIHRDIKPANIMVRPDYRIALSDFGIAHRNASELTQVGELLGSPLYMSPEQLRGLEIDQRTDLFAVGVVLYLMLTKRKPFNADSLAALMLKILHEEPPLASEINSTLSGAFDTVLGQALEKDPQRRFASAQDFATALRQARDAALDATRIMPRSSYPQAPTSTFAADETLPNAELASAALSVLVEQCLTDCASTARIQQLEQQLHNALARANPTLPTASQAAQRQALQTWYAAQPLTALAERIMQTAPLPGRIIRDARGDWLELVRLFALLRNGRQQLDLAQDSSYQQIIETMSGALVNYSNVLNALLFSNDGPQLMRIAADLLRLDVLQVALEELGADAEVRHMRQTLSLFANQIISRVNAMIQQFIENQDPLVRFDIVNLLVEVEELIALAERLLENNQVAISGQPGGIAMTQLISNAHALGEILLDELGNQLKKEQHILLDQPQLKISNGQMAFVGRLQQLGLLYRFAAYWQTSASEHKKISIWAQDLRQALENLTDALFGILEDHTGVETIINPIWERLSIIANLAEKCGWSELQQRILLCACQWARAA